MRQHKRALRLFTAASIDGESRPPGAALEIRLRLYPLLWHAPECDTGRVIPLRLLVCPWQGRPMRRAKAAPQASLSAAQGRCG